MNLCAYGKKNLQERWHLSYFQLNDMCNWKLKTHNKWLYYFLWIELAISIVISDDLQNAIYKPIEIVNWVSFMQKYLMFLQNKTLKKSASKIRAGIRFIFITNFVTSERIKTVWDGDLSLLNFYVRWKYIWCRGKVEIASKMDRNIV